MRATDVFKPQGTPTITLVRDPVPQRSSQDFDDAIEEGGKLIRVLGPSKSGKTVFVSTKAHGADLVRVSASGIQSGMDLWNRVLASAGVDIQTSVSSDSEKTIAAEVGAKASAGVLVAKAETEGKLKVETTAGRTVNETRASDPLQAVIKCFSKQKSWIFIDDFHYASPDVQKQLAEQIKHVSEEGVQLIIALIPGRSEDIIQANADLQGRIVNIPFKYWEIGELSQIAESGFPALGIQVDPGSSSQLAKEAAGTPQLMQAICLEFARECGARESLNPPRHCNLSAQIVASVCSKLAGTRADFSSTIEQMRKGPPTRGMPRKRYPKTGEGDRDVYELLVDSYRMDPPLLKLTSDQLQERVNRLAGSEVASVWDSVRHMSEIANNMHTDRKIDFGADLRWVAILDPYLFFALRWGEQESGE